MKLRLSAIACCWAFLPSVAGMEVVSPLPNADRCSSFMPKIAGLGVELHELSQNLRDKTLEMNAREVDLKLAEDQLENDKQAFNEALGKNALASGKVTMNVGGTKFELSVATLNQQNSSFFRTMLSEQYQKESDSTIFIDRCV
jgi:hypothetical protein